jgi:hypothetical protein
MLVVKCRNKFNEAREATRGPIKNKDGDHVKSRTYLFNLIIKGIQKGKKWVHKK